MGNKRKASNEFDKDSDASSGYFSALDQTDFEDMGPRSTALHRMKTCRQVPFIPGTHPGISPMIVMKNFLLKQANSVAPALKPWTLNPSIDVVPQSPLLFLQPVIPTGDCTPQRSDKQKHSRRHVPMQSTFPKIAPHPAQGFAVDLAPSAINKKSNHSHSGRHQQHSHGDKTFQSSTLKHDETFDGYSVDTNAVSWGEVSQTVPDMSEENSSSKLSDSQEPHTTTSPFSLCSDSFLTSSPQKCPNTTVTESSDAENISEAHSPSSCKRKRFCNTYNILNRSGLLGITLRTKELIRQNKRSQAQLKSLQAQTDLFLEAICSGDPKVWTRLQLTLQNSGDGELKAMESLVDSVRDAGADNTSDGCVV
ncbi:CLOCK-interacting pacemaker a [Xyrauchen texanus]|uniref:CLOCK-interacting pacemaker a n=1 Tax=Xyrauchen texanus TaxID=154827 RepID=UPI002241D873|nr:CLOCK-interacting pacemaker a [Xyrauchen texanus]